MRKTSFLTILFIGLSFWSAGQITNIEIEVQLVGSPSIASLRGLDAISEDIVWVTGSKGTYLRTVDAGITWKHGIIIDSLDFRDIHAFDADRAVVISSGFPATIFKTIDGGDTWELKYINYDERVFIDAVDFWDNNMGFAFGDAIDGSFFMIVTSDGGEKWEKLESAPEAIEGEGGFAASGTNIIISPGGDILLGTTTGRLLKSSDRGKSWSSLQSPIESSKPTSGIFSIAASKEKAMMVGGDFQEENNMVKNAAFMDTSGNWHLSIENPPKGFRSGVAFIPGTTMLICTGPGGTDISYDAGRNWETLTDEGFHALSFGENQNSGWMSGSSGRIAKIILPD